MCGGCTDGFTTDIQQIRGFAQIHMPIHNGFTWIFGRFANGFTADSQQIREICTDLHRFAQIRENAPSDSRQIDGRFAD